MSVSPDEIRQPKPARMPKNSVVQSVELEGET